MSSTDPLTEARDALRQIHDLLAWPNGDGPWRSKAYDMSDRIWTLSTEALARLDALPAPSRVEAGEYPHLAFARDVWVYPDAEAAS